MISRFRWNAGSSARSLSVRRSARSMKGDVKNKLPLWRLSKDSLLDSLPLLRRELPLVVPLLRGFAHGESAEDGFGISSELRLPLRCRPAT